MQRLLVSKHESQSQPLSHVERSRCPPYKASNGDQPEDPPSSAACKQVEGHLSQLFDSVFGFAKGYVAVGMLSGKMYSYTKLMLGS